MLESAKKYYSYQKKKIFRAVIKKLNMEQ
jgi:hypothetical protein